MKNARIPCLAIPLLLLVAACATAPASGSSPSSGDLGGSVFSPTPGVVCDRQGGICAESTNGLSAGQTMKWLGNDVGAKLQKTMVDNPNMATDEFTLSNGVRCNTQKRTCLVKGTSTVDQATQRALFP